MEKFFIWIHHSEREHPYCAAEYHKFGIASLDESKGELFRKAFSEQRDLPLFYL